MSRVQRSLSFSCARRLPIAVAFFSQVFHPGVVAAQTGAWSAPSSGYLYDSNNRTIRSVTGFIGSAVLGPSVTGGIDWASLAPNHKYAIAEQNGSQVWIPDLASGDSTQVLDRIPPAHQAFWADDASQAAILAEGNQLIWITNFSSGPVPVSTWHLDDYVRPSGSNQARNPRVALVRTRWSVLAADSSAERVLLASYSDETWQIWIASRTAPPQNIAFSGRPVAAAFARGNADVFVADGAGHRIVQIRNSDTIPDPSDVVSSAVYVNDPTAMVVSSDGSRLFVADGADSVIRVFDVSTGSSTPISELSTGTPPLSLTLFAKDRFVLNAGVLRVRPIAQTGSQPVFFLDTGIAPGISFVPGEQ